MNQAKTFSLDEISVLAELPRRTVRYYIQCGLIDRPQGIGKGAFYSERHVEQLLLVRKWQLAGLSERSRSGAIWWLPTVSSSRWSRAVQVSRQSRFGRFFERSHRPTHTFTKARTKNESTCISTLRRG
jgi:hypothetical protein